MAWHVRPAREFAACAEDWRTLTRACGNTPLLDAGFVASLLEYFSTGNEVVATLRDGEAVTAMGVFAPAGRFGWNTLQPANAPLGFWLQTPGTQLADVLPTLARALSPTCLILGLTQQDPDINPRPQPTPQISTLDYIETARITVPGSFADWWGARSKNLRHDVTRQKNRFKRDGVAAQLHVLKSPADMARAVSDYGRLESAGWKGAIESAVTEGGTQARFYTDVLESFAKQGEVIVSEYLLDDTVVACDLCLLRDGVLYILKTAYDESRQGTSSAHLMRHDLFGSTFDDGTVKTVEFYGRAMEWHRRLTGEIRTMYHVNWYRWSPLRTLHRRSS